MANPWFRVWADMINDPKWRTIARASKQKIGDVVAVYLHMMTCASNATERGRTHGFNDEDVATALDLGIEQVEAIREAMQGRVLDGDYLTGWEKRQPLREDGAADRSKAWRDAQKEAKQTQPNASERNRTLEEIRVDKSREDKKEEEQSKPLTSKAEATPRASRLPADWIAPPEYIDHCKAARPDLDPAWLQEKFRDYWSAKPGKDGLKLDWLATWRNFCKTERAPPKARDAPRYEKFDPLSYVNRNRIKPHERTTFDERGNPV